MSFSILLVAACEEHTLSEGAKGDGLIDWLIEGTCIDLQQCISSQEAQST